MNANKTVAVLKQESKALGAKSSGNKSDLIERLKLWTNPQYPLNRTLVDPVQSAVNPQQTVYPAVGGETPLIQLKPEDVPAVSIIAISDWFDTKSARAGFEKGRKMFLAKFVKCTEYKEMKEGICFNALCSAETTKNKDYAVKAIVNQDGVLQATCAELRHARTAWFTFGQNKTDFHCPSTCVLVTTDIVKISFDQKYYNDDQK